MQKIINVRIEGIKAMLVNRPPDEDKDAYGKRKSTKRIRVDVEKKLYKHDGKLVLPAEHVFQALIKVGARYKAKGVKYATYKTLIMSYVVVKPEFIPMTPQEWVVDRRSAVIPSTRGRIMVERPRFDDWSMKFKLVVLDDDYINIEDLNNILIEAGMTNGLGTYRPRFGLFKVTEWEPQEE